MNFDGIVIQNILKSYVFVTQMRAVVEFSWIISLWIRLTNRWLFLSGSSRVTPIGCDPTLSVPAVRVSISRHTIDVDWSLCET